MDSSTQLIFHYTSIDSAIGILSSHTLRATNLRSLDDNNELIGGGRALQNILSDIYNKSRLNGQFSFNSKYLSYLLCDDNTDSFYSISFCLEDNSPYMWQNYAQEGCCFIFKSNSLLQGLKSSQIPLAHNDFLECNYYSERDLYKYAELYLQSFNTQRPNVIIRKLTWDDLNASDEEIGRDLPIISIEDELMSFLRFAFQVKINTDKNQYQNERETRIVFHPIANHPREQINPKTGKKYIEVVMNPDEFYNSIVGVRVSPVSSNIVANKERLHSCFSSNEFMHHIKLL